jgi:hypothetical protein
VNISLENGDWVIPHRVTQKELVDHLIHRDPPPGPAKSVLVQHVSLGNDGRLTVLNANGQSHTNPAPSRMVDVKEGTSSQTPIERVTTRSSDPNKLFIVYTTGLETTMVVPADNVMPMVTLLMGTKRLVADVQDSGTVYTRP